jgi:hypothetical protein
MVGSFNWSIQMDFVHHWEGMVDQIAAEYRRKYPMVEHADITQELWLWFASHTRKLTEWSSDDYSEKDRIKLVAKSLRNAAYDFCLKQKAQIEGYDPGDVFFYRKEFIKTLLPAILSGDWSRIAHGVISTGGTPRALSESGDWMAYTADIKTALDKLSHEDRELVVEFYGNELTGSDLHSKILPEKTTARAAMMQANRALNKMVRHLGGFPPFKDPKDEEYESRADGVGHLHDDNDENGKTQEDD